MNLKARHVLMPALLASAAFIATPAMAQLGGALGGGLTGGLGGVAGGVAGGIDSDTAMHSAHAHANAHGNADTSSAKKTATGLRRRGRLARLVPQRRSAASRVCRNSLTA